jgi:hypothetical protein
MDKKNKFSKFVAKIEKDMLDGKKESMILDNNNMINYFGGANGSCVNEASSCNSSTNRNCTNHNSSGCDGAVNRSGLFGSGCQNKESLQPLHPK